MIWLADDCLVFELQNGESVPLSASMLCFETVGKTPLALEPDFIQDVAASVFYYFKHDLERETVSVGEFALAMEKALCERGYAVHTVDVPGPDAVKPGDDLRRLAQESHAGGELMFYTSLREAVRGQLRQSPEVIRFHGLRSCVKQLTGARRWGARCERLRDQILDYLRRCLGADALRRDCSLVVE